MNVYELINPSDETTLEAPNLEVAAFSAILLSPHYGVKNIEDEEDSFFSFMGAVDAFTKQWGDPSKFLAENEDAIADCLDSFAYISAGERQRYKLALELIDDPKKRQRFRDEHEDRKRSSMSQICKAAWQYAKMIREAARKNKEKTVRT